MRICVGELCLLSLCPCRFVRVGEGSFPDHQCVSQKGVFSMDMEDFPPPPPDSKQFCPLTAHTHILSLL